MGYKQYVDGRELVARMYNDDIETMMDDYLQIIFQIRESTLHKKQTELSVLYAITGFQKCTTHVSRFWWGVFKMFYYIAQHCALVGQDPGQCDLTRSLSNV